MDLPGMNTQEILRPPETKWQQLMGLKDRMFGDGSVMEPGFKEGISAPEGTPVDFSNIGSVAGGRIREMAIDPMKRYANTVDRGMSGQPMTISDLLAMTEGNMNLVVGGSFPENLSGGGSLNKLNMFVGPSAKETTKAEAMFLRGASKEEIHAATLMHKKPDGFWRKEISDADMAMREYPSTPTEAVESFRADMMTGKAVGMDDIYNDVKRYDGMPTQEIVNLSNKKQAEINRALETNDIEKIRGIMDNYPGLESIKSMMKGRRYGPLSEYVDNPSLYDKYPELKNLHTRMSDDGLSDGTQGVYRRESDFQGEQIQIRPPRWDQDAKPTITHELQHGIQNKEGWARGGNPYEFARGKDAIYKEISLYNDELGRLSKKMDQAKIDGEEQTVEYLKKKYDLIMENKMNLVDDAQADPYESYQNLTGEREARDTASRLTLTEAQRRETPPDFGEGGIVRGGGGGALSVEYSPSLMKSFDDITAFRKANNLEGIKMRKSGGHPTQIATTKKTYRKIFDNLVSEDAKKGKVLDYGAGKNIGGKELGADTYEPYPDAGFKPTFSDPAQIPSNAYDTVINNAVLNVVPENARDHIVSEIGRTLKPGGKAFVNVRGKDVFDAKHHLINKDTMEVIIDGSKAYQKGFTQKELESYIGGVLGERFKITPGTGKNKFGSVGVIVEKH